ncbi:MAG: lysyl oxidase family protein [Spirosomataceae bacterium]
MKPIFLLLFCLILFEAKLKPSLTEFRFNSLQTNVSIPDFNGAQTHPLFVIIPVRGLPSKADSVFGIERVQLAIKHPRISDIKVELRNPQGLVVWITNRNGNDGANYNQTVFSQNGFRGPISEGTPPFTGHYIPDGQLANFNQSSNPNGDWTLIIYDLKQGIDGVFEDCSLFFSNNPAVRSLGPCSVKTPQGCQCPNGKKNCTLLPDLVLNEAKTKQDFVETFNQSTQLGSIRFAVSVFNKGFGPLELRGDNKWMCGNQQVKGSVPCPDGQYARQGLEQVIYHFDGKRITTSKRMSGTIAYDARPGHEHFHADYFVNYTLFKPIRNDTTKWKIIGKGTKASFCIWDLGYCRDDIKNCMDHTGKIYTPNNMSNYGLGTYIDCNESLQGLSVGGEDLYGSAYEGQTIMLPKGTKNGQYFLKIEVDPYNKFTESNETNNTFFLPINLKRQKPI